jgi:uncharacterized membrane protein YkvA (DUF1232 family)
MIGWRFVGRRTMDGEVVVNNSDPYLAKTRPEPAHDSRPFRTKWKDRAQRVQKEAHVLYLVFRDPRTPWYAKWVAAFPVAYLFSPVQLIPNFIPVIGFLDDFLFLLLGAKLVNRLTPTDLLRECRAIADLAEVRGREDMNPGPIRSAIILTVASGLLAAIASSALVAAYIYR